MSGTEKPSIHETINRLLAEWEYGEVAHLLEPLDDAGNGETHARLALAYFQAEQYDKAMMAYAQALTYEPDNLEWRALLALAEANLFAAMGMPCPNCAADDEEEPFFFTAITPLSSPHVYYSLN